MSSVLTVYGFDVLQFVNGVAKPVAVVAVVLAVIFTAHSEGGFING